MWIQNESIPEGRSGCHTKLSSLFNDEEVQLFVREFISSKGEEITSSLLAQAVTEFVGSKEMGANVQASLEMADAETDGNEHREPKSLKARAARYWLKSMGYSWRNAKKGFTSMATSATMSSSTAKTSFSLNFKKFATGLPNGMMMGV